MMNITHIPNADSLPVDTIKKVVTGAGHYLGEEQTLELMETEFVYPKHADRASPSDWEDAGSNDVWVRASLHADQILSREPTFKINAETDAKIRSAYAIHLEQRTSI